MSLQEAGIFIVSAILAWSLKYTASRLHPLEIAIYFMITTIFEQQLLTVIKMNLKLLETSGSIPSFWCFNAIQLAAKPSLSVWLIYVCLSLRLRLASKLIAAACWLAARSAFHFYMIYNGVLLPHPNLSFFSLVLLSLSVLVFTLVFVLSFRNKLRRQWC